MRFGKGDKTIVCVLSGIACVSFIIWMSCFLALSLPEVIRAHEWSKYSCYTTNKSIDRSYRPIVECHGCLEASSDKHSCSSVKDKQSAQDPDLCSEDPAQCAHETDCDDGYQCCKDEDGVCTRSVLRRLCSVDSIIWYRTAASGTYINRFEEPQNFTYSKNHKDSRSKADDVIHAIVLYERMPCWSHPETPDVVAYDVKYTPGYWVICGIFAGMTITSLISIGVIVHRRKFSI